MNQQQQIRLLELAGQMRQIAVTFGTLHGWWDVIFDIEAFVKDQPTIVAKTADEWIRYAEQCLNERAQKK